MASRTNINSHTNAQLLLAQFAFDGPTRGSKRLWRYEKNHNIELQIGLKSATAHKGHFKYPPHPGKEEQLEDRLNREVEQPVNKFLADLKYSVFHLNSTQRDHMAKYITTQFHRSAHRKSLKLDQRMTLKALQEVAADEKMVAQIAECYSYETKQTVTPEQAVDGLHQMIARYSTDEQSQRGYFEMVENMMEYRDETLIAGEWERVYTDANNPFVIGDAPVVTWNRVDGIPVPGVGFGEPDVEVLFPIAPTACLHILPRIQRTRRVRTPTVREVNEAQAAFATQHCFSNINSIDLDAVLQQKFGTLRMGESGFNIDGKFDSKKHMFESLINVVGIRHPPLLIDLQRK
jgi:hypothetical protein